MLHPAIRTKFPRHCATLTVIALLSGCAGAPPQPVGEQRVLPDSAVTQAEDSSAKGNFVIAAQSYLTLARQSSGAERQRHLLAAAAILTRGQHIRRANAIMEGIDVERLPADDLVRYHFTRARIALLELEPQQAIDQLRQPAATIPADMIVDWHSLRAEAYTMLGNQVEAVRERILLEPELNSAELIRANHKQIWDNLTHLSNAALKTLRSTLPPNVLSGWLELAQIHQSNRHDPEQLEQRLKEWLDNYSDHPAADEFIAELLIYQDIRLDRPDQVALLLPFSGNFANAAKAVRDGFLGAYYSRNGERYVPEIRIYNTTEDVATGLKVYQRAVEEGADFIVGPLHKPLVEALADSARPQQEPDFAPPALLPEVNEPPDAPAQPNALPVPTLALNYWSKAQLVADNFYQFGLLPEDETRQAAERAWLDGYNQALILAPEGEWGERMYATFVEHWQQLDGRMVEAQRYDPSRHDFSGPVIELLNIDDSRQRKRKLEQLTGLDIKFEPRRRQDVDFIYLAAFPNQARQIRPQLKFYYAADIPVYASSHVYSGEEKPGLDRDMDGILFCDMPWVFNDGAGGKPDWRTFTDIWHGNAVPFKRLYAMGIDAYRLIGRLTQLRDNPQAHFNAATGTLYLDQANRIHRQLLWARFRGGKPQLIEAIAVQDEAS